MGGSSGSSSSKPKDMTPPEFKALRQPFADQLKGLLSAYKSSSPNANDKLVNGYQGPLTSGGPNAAETAQLQALNAAANAPAGGSNVDANTNTFLDNTMASGGSAAAAKDFVDQLGIGGGPQKSLADFSQELSGASQTGAFGGDNPFLQSYIQSAQRQTQQALEETLSRTLPGRFALAGQRTQPGGSSAFDRAAAIATRGAADALGDIATNISYDALESARGREASALGSELDRRSSQDMQTQQLETAAQQQQLDRALQSPEIKANLEQSGANIQTAEVDNMLKNLQAQALPRMIQDLGIERGMEAFNNNVNALLSGLGLATGATRPVVGNSSSSSQSQFGLK